jgi:Helix-turn-helix domain
LSARSIAEIAFSCGFGDISHFNHCFRSKFGMSPREYQIANIIGLTSLFRKTSESEGSETQYRRGLVSPKFSVLKPLVFGTVRSSALAGFWAVPAANAPDALLPPFNGYRIIAFERIGGSDDVARTGTKPSTGARAAIATVSAARPATSIRA